MVGVGQQVDIVLRGELRHHANEHLVAEKANQNDERHRNDKEEEKHQSERRDLQIDKPRRLLGAAGVIFSYPCPASPRRHGARAAAGAAARLRASTPQAALNSFH